MEASSSAIGQAGEPSAAGKAVAETGRRNRGVSGTRILLWIAVVLIMLFCLFPFYWLLNTALKTGTDLSSASIVPPSPSLDNFTSVFRNDNFVMALKSSVIISFSVTILSLVIGSFAGYALARLRFPRKFLLLAIVLSISTFPSIAIAAPVFQLWNDLEVTTPTSG